jgi:hypothetical protein
MKDFVSSYWISLVTLVTSMSVVCSILVHYGYPGTALVGVALFLSVGVLMSIRPTRSMSDVIRDVESEPTAGDAVPVRAMATGGMQPGLKGKETR